MIKELESERSPKVNSANWKEEILLQGKLKSLDRSQTSIVRQISIDQKVTCLRFHKKRWLSQMCYARAVGNHDLERQLREEVKSGANTYLPAPGVLDFLANLKQNPFSGEMDDFKRKHYGRIGRMVEKKDLIIPDIEVDFVNRLEEPKMADMSSASHRGRSKSMPCDDDDVISLLSDASLSTISQKLVASSSRPETATGMFPQVVHSSSSRFYQPPRPSTATGDTSGSGVCGTDAKLPEINITCNSSHGEYIETSKPGVVTPNPKPTENEQTEHGHDSKIGIELLTSNICPKPVDSTSRHDSKSVPVCVSKVEIIPKQSTRVELSRYLKPNAIKTGLLLPPFMLPETNDILAVLEMHANASDMRRGSLNIDARQYSHKTRASGIDNRRKSTLDLPGVEAFRRNLETSRRSSRRNSTLPITEHERRPSLLDFHIEQVKSANYTEKVKDFCDSVEKFRCDDADVDYYASRLMESVTVDATKCPDRINSSTTPDDVRQKGNGQVEKARLTMKQLNFDFDSIDDDYSVSAQQESPLMI